MTAFIISNILSMSIKYLWEKSPTGSYYFKRRVPQDVREHVGKDFLQVCLHTRDIKEATKKIHVLAKQADVDWEHIRSPSKATVFAKAYQLLEKHGVDPNLISFDDPGFDSLVSQLDEKLPEHKRMELDSLSRRELETYFTEIERTALKLAQGKFTASDCLELYVEMRCKGKPTAEKTARIAFGYLIDNMSDRELKAYSRSDANSFVKYLLSKKQVKTATVARYLSPIKAAWGLAIREREIKGLTSPWDRIDIPDLGKDTVDRSPFTVTEYKALYTAIEAPQDDLRCMLILLAETGARLAEIIGLGADDCYADADIPYIDIRYRPWRSLKNKKSIRQVPMTLKALEALKTAIALSGSSPYLFPRYVDGKKANATSASAALNKYIRKQEINLTVHCLRHGLTDLLRAVRTPEPMRKQIQGWGGNDVADDYGQGYSMAARRDELVKATSIISVGS